MIKAKFMEKIYEFASTISSQQLGFINHQRERMFSNKFAKLIFLSVDAATHLRQKTRL
jgi:hypothetical protein